MSRISGDLVVENLRVTGTLETVGAVSGVARSELDQETLTVFPLLPEMWRVHDNMDALLPDPPVDGSNDDLGIVSGTYGTAVPTLQTGDCKTVTVTKYARMMVALPSNYVAGETVVIRLHAGMVTTLSDGATTCDVQAFLAGEDMLVSGADLCATAAQSCKSLTLADKDFTITPTTLTPGAVLDVRIAISIADTATVTAVKGVIGMAKLLCDTKG